MKDLNNNGRNSIKSYAVSNGVEIIPAIMPDSYDDLVEKVSRVKDIVPCVQIDVMDGQFVPPISWPYDRQGKKKFASMVKDGKMLPFWEDISYEVDLMVEYPKKIVLDWMSLGVCRILIHIESSCNPREVISVIETALSKEVDFEPICPVEFGIALSAETPLDKIAPYVYDVDVVQLMGIKKVGYQGEPFDEEVVERVKSLRAEYPHLIISVDGGVNLESAPKLITAGVSRLVSGSAIFDSLDIQETISKLTQV